MFDRYTYVLIYPDGRLLDWDRGRYLPTRYVDAATHYTEAGARHAASELADHGLRVLDLADFPPAPLVSWYDELPEESSAMPSEYWDHRAGEER